MPVRTYYDVLGVERTATVKELRDAHRRLARMLHPDHLATVPLSDRDRALAEMRIREVNEAWKVLGDPASRAAYDRTLGPLPITWRPPWEGQPAAPPTPVVRAIPATFPWKLLLATALGIVTIVFIAVATIGQTDDDPTSVFAVDIGVCVTISEGPTTRTVSCDEPNDGEIVAFVDAPDQCPEDSAARRLVKGAPGLACLTPK